MSCVTSPSTSDIETQICYSNSEKSTKDVILFHHKVMEKDGYVNLRSKAPESPVTSTASWSGWRSPACGPACDLVLAMCLYVTCVCANHASIMYGCVFAGNLQELGVLSLRCNQLEYLPSTLGNCTALHVLDVSGNRWDWQSLSSHLHRTRLRQAN